MEQTQRKGAVKHQPSDSEQEHEGSIAVGESISHCSPFIWESGSYHSSFPSGTSSWSRELALWIYAFPWHCWVIQAMTPICASICAPHWQCTAQIEGAPNGTDISGMIPQALRYDPSEECVGLISQLQQGSGMFCDTKVAAKLKMSPHPQEDCSKLPSDWCLLCLETIILFY